LSKPDNLSVNNSTGSIVFGPIAKYFQHYKLTIAGLNMLPREEFNKNERHNFIMIWIVSSSMTHHFLIQRPQKNHL